MEPYLQELQVHKVIMNKTGFEGWYFKVCDQSISLAVIVGLSTAIDNNQVFIQTIETNTHTSHVISYPMKDFMCSKDHFEIQIKDNIFSESRMVLHMKDHEYSLNADVKFTSFTKLHTNYYAPTIMGPFSYFPKMECIHSIISLHHHVNGTVKINQQEQLIDGIGYVEKDRGTSFPSKYIWIQSNDCKNKQATLFFSSATIPFYIFSFKGTIAVIEIEGKQLRFATYLGARIRSSYEKDGYYYISVKQFSHRLYLRIKQGNTCQLQAPKLGIMSSRVEESLDSSVSVVIFKKQTKIATLHFDNCGLEIAQFFTK